MSAAQGWTTDFGENYRLIKDFGEISTKAKGNEISVVTNILLSFTKSFTEVPLSVVFLEAHTIKLVLSGRFPNVYYLCCVLFGPVSVSKFTTYTRINILDKHKNNRSPCSETKTKIPPSGICPSPCADLGYVAFWQMVF